VTSKRIRARVGQALFVALLGLAPATSLAHRFQHPKLLRLGVKEGRLLLAVTYDLDPGTSSARTRALFDRDASGALEQEEREKLSRYLEATARLWLQLEVDGRPVSAERLDAALSGADRPVSASDSLGLALLYAYPLPAGREVQVRLRDRDRDERRHVPVEVDVGPGWAVAFASQGELFPDTRTLSRIRLDRTRELRLVLRRVPIRSGEGEPRAAPTVPRG
jgi:hypothetical protein